MPDPAIAFASSFDLSFRSLTHGLSSHEIPLFRAMQRALLGLSDKFEIEEYHGSSRQVKFAGNGSYARTNARCELSDLMIVTFSSITKSVRLTYLQAKSERATLFSERGHHFGANLEQWFLLSVHPLISGAGRFDPPADLLKSALLASVGSFVFFYKDGAGAFQTYYVMASHLAPPAVYCQRYGKLASLGPSQVLYNAGYMECTAAFGNEAFAESLFRLEIGTPVHTSIAQTLPTRKWLAANLRAQMLEARQADRRTALAEELLGILSESENIGRSGSFGAKSLIIIKSTAKPHDSIAHE